MKGRVKDGSDSAFEGGGPARGRRGQRRAAATTKLIDTPMAIASDGTLLINLTHLDSAGDVLRDARRLMRDGHQVFVGVALGPGMRRLVLREVDQVLADVVGRAGPRLSGPRR